MMIHMKPGQWDFFWDWHVESPDLTLADMLRIIREEKESAEAEEAASSSNIGTWLWKGFSYLSEG